MTSFYQLNRNRKVVNNITKLFIHIIKIMEAKDTTVDVVEVDKNEENTNEQIQTDTEQQTVS